MTPKMLWRGAAIAGIGLAAVAGFTIPAAMGGATSRPLPTSANVPDHPVDVGALQRAAHSKGYGAQEQALADGVVDSSEHAAAIDATIACARAQGVTVSDPTSDWSGTTQTYSFDNGTLADGRSAIAVHDACYEQNAIFVDQVFQYSQGPARKAVVRGVVNCLRSRGVSVSDSTIDLPAVQMQARGHDADVSDCLGKSRKH